MMWKTKNPQNKNVFEKKKSTDNKNLHYTEAVINFNSVLT